MRITYIARHDQKNSNDDEGAIAYALTKLGHEVNCVHEGRSDLTCNIRNTDMVLFHHWKDCHVLQGLDVIKVCWCFDLIEHDDPTLAARCCHRRAWAAKVKEIADFAFFTDGDWAAKSGGHWLPQGADERIVGTTVIGKSRDLLLTGISQGGGLQRESFVTEMIATYGDRFRHISKGVYREQLREMIGRHRIVVCPDSPVTNRYWSNRVYNACGFGAFVLHSFCQKLAEQYSDGQQIVYYNDREHLHKLIQWYLEDEKGRARISAAALERTRFCHTYRHRCVTMLDILKNNQLSNRLQGEEPALAAVRSKI